MRQIKFRGQRTDTKKFVYGYVFETPLTSENFKPCFFGQTKPRMCIADKDGVVFTVIPESVEQYSGLNDKNDKEIYEGDIIKVYANEYDCSDDTDESKFEYEFVTKVGSIENAFLVDVVDCDYGSTSIHFLEYSYENCEIEVIGNIHDNPELLNVQ